MRTLLSIAVLMMSLLSWATVLTHNDGPLTEAEIEQLNQVDSLIIHSGIRDKDFEHMWHASFYGNLKYIDLGEQYDNGLYYRIPDSAFYRPFTQLLTYEWRSIKLEEVKIGTGWDQIGRAAFKGCTNLKKVDFPEGFHSVFADAFEYCSSLKKIRHRRLS